jgi:hypothetical protein
MDRQEQHHGNARDDAPIGGYERPRVERVLAPADLEREILYAGVPPTPPPPP